MPDDGTSDSRSVFDGLPMETAEFSIPGLRGDRDAVDLSNALNAISGVAAVQVDLVASLVRVQFDTGHVSKQSLQAMICKSGYPVA
ncbi:MAG TPA: heavy-metal-associated domain-containing protein [Chloroflexota bacterium]|nr:heavy-metal-associated domain-containing protein [Chloroflexota bacterium]